MEGKNEKNRFFVYLIFLIVVNFLVSADSIINYLGQIIRVAKIKYGKKEFIVKMVIPLPEKNPFAELVNKNTSYINYLLVNFSKVNDKELMKNSDSDKLEKAFFEELKKDNNFINLLKEFEYYYINKNVSVEKKKVVSLERVIEIATKFFTISKIVNDKYEMHICVGINLIRDTEKERFPHVEAFLINSILNDMKSKKRVIDNLSEVMTNVKKLNFGIDKEKRLLRVQGALLMKMFENPKLRKLIVSEYRKNRKYLNFTIKGI
jgi:hypothetical protein